MLLRRYCKKMGMTVFVLEDGSSPCDRSSAPANFQVWLLSVYIERDGYQCFTLGAGTRQV